MSRFRDLYEAAKNQNRLWSPSLDGASCYFDGTDQSKMTIDANGKVSSWTCGIMNAAVTQAVETQIPIVYRKGGRTNDRIDGIKFTAASQTTLKRAGPFTYSNFTCLVLTTEQGTTQTQEPLYNGLSTTNGWGFLNNWSTDPNKMQGIYGAIAVLQANPSPRVIGNSYLSILSRTTNNTNYFEVNGVQYSVSNSNFVTPTGGFSVGAPYEGGGGWYDGIVHSIIVYPRALTDFERKRAAASLLWKHEMLSIIPSSNPFKDRPPLKGD